MTRKASDSVPRPAQPTIVLPDPSSRPSGPVANAAVDSLCFTRRHLADFKWSGLGDTPHGCLPGLRLQQAGRRERQFVPVAPTVFAA